METIFCEDIPLDRNCEYYEFSLGKAEELRCSKAAKGQDCGECESCLLSHCILSTKNWFWRCSHQVKKRFLAGLIQRYHSVDLLKYTVQLLKPLISKDYTYARSRIVPSLETDTPHSSSNRALSMADIEANIKFTWNWFVSSNYWTKSNFLLGLFQLCDTHLLFVVGNHAKTMLASEIKAMAHRDNQYSSRVSSAVEAFRANTSTEILSDDNRPLTAPDVINRSPNADYTNGTYEDEPDDPTLYISPSSEKALVGVTRYRDFIRELPVHLSKYILGYLDEAALFNCSKVSQHWHLLVEELRADFYANQQMWEDIMLMQGSSGVHPNYANDIDVLVPNVKVNIHECIRVDDQDEPKILRDDRNKSDMSFENAYRGYSTRKVIMEERNVYCGSYNVLVLVNEYNKDRVVHTCGGKYLAYSKEKKCHLIDINLGRDTEHPIAGHSGSIKCVNIQEEDGFILTGSFDMSIRNGLILRWDLNTLKCVKIYNGHQDSVVALNYCKKSRRFASASLDKSCKVWDLDKKTCFRTFKHRARVLVVALSETQCISGCEQGRIKVWNLETGRLIKMLLGHDGLITAIKFDIWHITTASQDGYALVWSNQGNHRRCLTALRHPCPVLCMEFVYLRVITGAEDGRVRIWNAVTGQCCRIMRGNSQSDPVLSLYAINDRLTINTRSNVLMLTFESIEWDYSYESDRVISFVEDNKYPHTPLKQYSYGYIRAQRMAHTGTADVRLFPNSQKPKFSRKTSARSLNSTFSQAALASTIKEDDQTDFDKFKVAKQENYTKPVESKKYQATKSLHKIASTSNLPDKRDGFQKHVNQRRVSWAFEHPEIPNCTEPSLNEMKAMLKKQIRGTAQTPDFIYLTISALKAPVLSSYPYETSNNIESSKPKNVNKKSILRLRPQSSPSSIDSKTKVRIADVTAEVKPDSRVDDTRSIKNGHTPSAKSNRSIKSADSVGYVKSTIAPDAPPRALSAQTVRIKSASLSRCQSVDSSRRQKSAKQLSTKGSKQGLSSTATDISIVPMLMYPKDGLKPNIDPTRSAKWPSQESIAQRHPLFSDKSLKLMTYTKESKFMQQLVSGSTTKTRPVSAPCKT